jgi:hypothetical protein
MCNANDMDILIYLQSSVGVNCVQPRSDFVVAKWGFLQGVMYGDRLVFGTSTLGTPASVNDDSPDCPIKGKKIHTDLTA